MNHAIGVGLLLFAGVLSGCVDHPVKTPKADATAAPPDETVSFHNLGQFWCLVDIDSSTIASTRAQIREVGIDDWEAFESKVQGSSTDYATCDAGRITFNNGAGACAATPSNPPLNPASDVLNALPYARISIVRNGTTTFHVSLKDNNGREVSQLGGFDMEASAGDYVAGAPVKYKWLYAQVPWHSASSVVTYDIFLYLVDDPTARNLPKRYRIEFFRTNSAACTDEEPIKSGRYNGPHLENGIECTNKQSQKGQIRQNPIGDGHHHAPTSANMCVY